MQILILNVYISNKFPGGHDTDSVTDNDKEEILNRVHLRDLHPWTCTTFTWGAQTEVPYLGFPVDSNDDPRIHRCSSAPHSLRVEWRRWVGGGRV